MNVVIPYFSAFVGAGSSIFIYDVAKLVRRDMRRKRKLAKETSVSNG